MRHNYSSLSLKGIDIIEEAHVGPEKILSLVDEYTLYSHYLGITDLSPRTPYPSPIRGDDSCASFSFWEVYGTDVEYLWKDSGRGISGDIFKLILLVKGFTSYHQVYRDINIEFDLDLFSDCSRPKGKIILYERKTKPPLSIRIKSIPFTGRDYVYWNQFGISDTQLSKYFVTRPGYVWWYDRQEAPSMIVSSHCYAYRIVNKYQIYWPYEKKENKFRNNLTDQFFGYLQLPKSGKKLVIDKSLKDIMFCDTIGLPAVAGKSETTPIPHYKMIEFKERFDEVFLTLDPDKAGRQQTEKYLSQYPWLKPRFLKEAKDKTDLCLVKGVAETRKIVKQLLQ